MDIVQEIRREARKAGISTYMLSKRSGVRVAAVQAFVKGGGLRCDTAQKLAAVLGFKVTLQPVGKGR